MKKIRTTTIALLLAHFAFAQLPTSVQRNIEWQSPVTTSLSEDSEPVTFWRFTDAVYSDEQPALPLFTERFKLESFGDFWADLFNPVFEPIEMTPQPGEGAIPNDIIIKVSVQKDRLDYFGSLSFLPIRRTGAGQYERLVSFGLRLNYSPKPAPAAAARGEHTYVSALSDGEIYKFAVSETGVHKLDFEFLKNQLGIAVEGLDPRTLKLFGNGGGVLPEQSDALRADDLVENAIEIIGEGDGKFDEGDYILFYAEGASRHFYDAVKQKFTRPANHYDAKNYYFLKISGGNGLRIADQASKSGGTYTTTTFSDFIRHERETFNLLHEWSSGQGSGKQWFGDQFKVTTEQNFDEEFLVEGIVPDATANLEAAFAGRIQTGSTGRYEVSANGSTFTSQNFSTTKGGSVDLYASLQSVSGNFTPGTDQFKVDLNFIRPTNSFNEGWLDYIEINFRRQLRMAGNQLIFRDLQTLTQPVSNFKLGNAGSDLVIWDISTPLSPLRQAAVLSNDEMTFGAETATLKEFVAFRTGGDFLKPEAVGKIENQNLHAITEVDMVIFHHKDFLEDAQRLAQHRLDHSDLSVALVDVDLLWNEFSSGRKDASAIRDFNKMVFDRSPQRFSSVLLFGDGSFDCRDLNKLGGDFVPVYETANSLNPIFAFPSDDYFGLLSDGEGANISTGMLEVGVGRLPVKTAEEAKRAVDKIIHYDIEPATLRDWRNRVAFIGDDEDNNTHTGDADGIASFINTKNSNVNTDKIYLDAFPQVSTPGGTRVPLATESLNNNIYKGVLAMVYLGHGGTKGWTQERVLKIEDILSWRNKDKLPLIITATCSFAGYDNPAFTTAGELCFLHEHGGAIALYTTVRPVFASANATLTKRSMDTLFIKLNNRIPTFGEALRLSKNKFTSPSDISNSRKFTLIGDPAQQLALPNHQVVTTKINGHDLGSGLVDTIRALQKVTLEGEIRDDAGNLLSDFSGVVYPTIYDKKVRYRTLSQDAGSPAFDFDLQKNIIFKGRASVTGGKFSVTFVVPKDIDYRYGNCKISYYASDETHFEDAAGNYEGVVVGGTDPNALADDRGPKVEVFMNDENFVFGGITSTDPVLFVKLEDDNGINVVGNSVGHDLAGLLDKNPQNTYIFNDFYEAALDDYTKGEVRYPLYNIATGRHNVKVNAWDISNNPAEGYTEFIVAESAKVALDRVLNYPNPFTTSTCFMFEHNQENMEMDVIVQIYTISGKLIKTLEERIFSQGSRLGIENCLRWDGRDDYGDPLGKGVYLYKVKVRNAISPDLTDEGESGFEKLVILK